MTTNPTVTLKQHIDEARRAHPAPLEATAHGFGTDAQEDLPALWSLVRAWQPRIILELGTRRGVSARTIAHAAEQVGALFMTCDPDPDCGMYLDGVRCLTHQVPGEFLYASRTMPKIDFLFIDTDPHDYAQTTMWLETFVATSLTPGGLAVFHDINARNVDGSPRPDIQVAPALRDWAAKAGGGYAYVELGHEGAGGLGVLRRDRGGRA